MSLKSEASQAAGERRKDADDVHLWDHYTNSKMGFKAALKTRLAYESTCELQRSEVGQEMLSHQLPLQTFIHLAYSTGVLHLALLKHHVDASEMSYSEDTASNMNWKNEVMVHMNSSSFLCWPNITGKYRD